MLKVTNEIREAARQLLSRHNARDEERADVRYEIGPKIAKTQAAEMGWTAQTGWRPNKARVREAAAREAPTDRAMRKRLEAIAEGKRKLIDRVWWSKVHPNVERAKIDKMEALADPARNDNKHERQVAAAKLAAAKARRTPGMRPAPPPLPEDPAEWERRRRKTKTRQVPQPLHRLSDSGAVPAKPKSDSVAAIKMTAEIREAMRRSDSKLKALNERRTAERAAKRANLKCQTCGKPLAAQRPTARYCNATCRSQAWRAQL